MRKNIVFNKQLNWIGIVATLTSTAISIAAILWMFSFISSSIKDAQKEIGGQGGLSGIIAKGIDAVEEFKEDIEKKRKK